MNDYRCIEKDCPFPRYRWTMRCLDHWQELGGVPVEDGE